MRKSYGERGVELASLKDGLLISEGHSYCSADNQQRQQQISQHRHKGQDTLQWTFIMLLLTMLLIAFVVSPMQQAVEEAARGNERLIVQELVTAINLAQSAPAETTYSAFIPARSRDECTIELKGGVLKATFADDGRKNVVFASYLVTDNEVVIRPPDGPINCKKERITITKTKVAGKDTVIVA